MKSVQREVKFSKLERQLKSLLAKYMDEAMSEMIDERKRLLSNNFNDGKFVGFSNLEKDSK
jgi:hypothetical protein